MTFALADAKIRLNIAASDTTRDTLIQSALDVSLALAERWCNRRFAFSQDAAEFIDFTGRHLQVARYPIAAVQSVKHMARGSISNPARGTEVHNYDIHNQAGMIVLRHIHVDSHLTVTYTGGFKVLPADLLMALWMLFDGYWPTMSGSGGSSVSAGDISSVTIPDVGTIRFADGGASGGASGAGAGSSLNVFSDPFAILQLYKRIES